MLASAPKALEGKDHLIPLNPGESKTFRFPIIGQAHVRDGTKTNFRKSRSPSLQASTRGTDPGDAVGDEFPRMWIDCSSGQSCQDHADRVRRWVGPSESSGRTAVAESFFRATGASGFHAAFESESPGSQSVSIVVADHFRRAVSGCRILPSPRRNSVKNLADVGRRRVNTAPRRAEISPVRAVPVPLLGG